MRETQRRGRSNSSNGSLSGHRLLMPGEAIQRRLLDAASQDIEELLPQLEPRAAELAALAIQKLSQRGAREEKDLRETLERQRDRVHEELAKNEGVFEQLTLHFDEEEKRQLESDIQRKRGDTSASDEVVRRFADRFWKTDWPGSSRPSVFFDPRSLDPAGPAGVLHAKAVVVDDEGVFITSANFTEAALNRNIELGVLIRDRAFALTVAGYFRNLIDRDLLKPLPMA